MNLARNTNREKVLNALMFFVQNTNRNKIGKTKMAKLLFALDFEHFKQTGRFVTGLNYFAYPNGPYPKELMEKMTEKTFPKDMAPFITLILKGDTKDDGGFLFKVKEGHSADVSLFSPREIEIMKNLAEIWYHYSGKDIVHWSHSKGSPWQILWEKENRKYELISYLYALDKDSPITKAEAENILKEEEEGELVFPTQPEI
jgi:hypothetical protein